MGGSGLRRMWNASCGIFRVTILSEGYFVSTVGRNEEIIRAYIGNREIADKQLDQL
jgi:REP element-mobilizing transposase RayT